MMQTASWAVLRLGLPKQTAVTQPRIALLAQQPPAVRLKRRGEACEGRQRNTVVRFGGKRRMEGREDGLESGLSLESAADWLSAMMMTMDIYARPYIPR